MEALCSTTWVAAALTARGLYVCVLRQMLRQGNLALYDIDIDDQGLGLHHRDVKPCLARRWSLVPNGPSSHQLGEMSIALSFIINHNKLLAINACTSRDRQHWHDSYEAWTTEQELSHIKPVVTTWNIAY